MTLALATVVQFEARLGRTLSTLGEQARVEALLDDFSALARNLVGLTWVEVVVVDDEDVETLTAPDGVAAVILAAALRVFRNPGGYTSESTGDWSGTRSTDGASGALAFTEAEARALHNLAGLSPLVSVPVVRDDIVGSGIAEYAYDQFGGDLIPWVAAEDAQITG